MFSIKKYRYFNKKNSQFSLLKHNYLIISTLILYSFCLIPVAYIIQYVFLLCGFETHVFDQASRES